MSEKTSRQAVVQSMIRISRFLLTGFAALLLQFTIINHQLMAADIVANKGQSAAASSSNSNPANTIKVPQSQKQIQLSFAPIVHRVSSSVVNIYASHKVAGQEASPLMNDPFFRQFFGDQLAGVPPRVENSLGSGVIVRNSGLIITNYHVIKGAEDIKVVLSDRREFDARIMKLDERSDLALLKIDSKESLPFIELADSDNLEVGDLVLALGNPFGVGQTVTTGIISALARSASDGNDSRYFIQTDAAINPGNSGGALVTLDGKLAGINTMILSQGGGSVGIGFAIPSNLVRTIIDNSGGTKVVRAWLGLIGQTVTAEIAQSLGMGRPTGAIVTSVYPNGPADKAGIKIGDIITTIDRHDIEDYGGLRFRIATLASNATPTVNFKRKDQTMTVAVKLMPAPETPPRKPILLKGNQPLAGAVVANLSPALAEEIGRPEDTIGIIVTEIKNGSNAAIIGIQPGDTIQAVNGSLVNVNNELEKLLSVDSSRWQITIKRGNKVFTQNIRM